MVISGGSSLGHDERRPLPTRTFTDTSMTSTPHERRPAVATFAPHRRSLPLPLYVSRLPDTRHSPTLLRIPCSASRCERLWAKGAYPASRGRQARRTLASGRSPRRMAGIMIFAELHGKLGEDYSRAHERAEDLLTSTVFGLLRYLTPADGLLAVLGHARWMCLEDGECRV